MIEGSIVNVCSNCSKFGKIAWEAEKFKTKIKTKHDIKNEDTELVVENYNEIIRREREKKGLKQDELARKLNEKESVIQRIENKQIAPSLNLAKKIEKFLGIKLIGGFTDTKMKLNHSETRGFTLGDVIK